MKTDLVTTKILVKENKIGILRVGNVNYISLTDLARYKNLDNPGDVIIKWMSNKSSFDFYSLWEDIHNEKFKVAESREFKNDSATQSFKMSPSRWIKINESARNQMEVLKNNRNVKELELLQKSQEVIKC